MSAVTVIPGTGLRKRNYEEIPFTRAAVYARVSTDKEGQEDSIKFQVKDLTKKIEDNPEEILAGVYSDEGVTGTLISRREEFKKLLNDCKEGKIDKIYTKSVTRFGRNTVEAINTAEELREMNVEIVFVVDGLSNMKDSDRRVFSLMASMAEEEVRRLSENVKYSLHGRYEKGISMSVNGLFGYDYDKESKTMSINECEAEHVRYIFSKYIDGWGVDRIARELTEKHIKTKKNKDVWCGSTIREMLSNEAYIGNIVKGKTYTKSPIKKQRVRNNGEYDKYVQENHHAPIISKETFAIVQGILQHKRELYLEKGVDHTIRYPLSGKVRCGFCGEPYHRRTHNKSAAEIKTVWECKSYIAHSRKSCPDSKCIDNEAIYKAFVEVHNILLKRQNFDIYSVLDEICHDLKGTTSVKDIKKIEATLNKEERNMSSLLDLAIDGNIDKKVFAEKKIGIQKKINMLRKELNDYDSEITEIRDIDNRVRLFKDTLQNGVQLTEFDEFTFKQIIESVIIGEKNDNGIADSDTITFILKSDILMSGECYTELFSFKMPYSHMAFEQSENGRKKRMLDGYTVKVKMHC